MTGIFSYWKRYLSTALIATLLATYIIIPTDSFADEKESISLVALLVDRELLSDLTLFAVPDDIQKANPSAPGLLSVGKRIETYAEDIQKKLPNTRVLIIPVSPDEQTWKIREALQNLYRNGDGGKEKTTLKGAVFIGSVPLPLITKDNTSFVSLYPYTDFDDPAFFYNFDTQQYEETQGHGNPQPEVWHGVITYPVSQEQFLHDPAREKAMSEAKEKNGDAAVNNLLTTYRQEYKKEMLKGLAGYFDKNHSFYTGGSYADFSKKALYADLFREMENIPGFAVAGYDAYLKNWENKSYLRYTKEWLNSLKSDFLSSSSIAARPFGVNGDGTAKTKEQYVQEMEKDIDANINLSAEKKTEAKKYLRDNAETTANIAENLETGGVLSKTLPDIFTRDSIEEILYTALEVFSSVSGNHINFFRNTGRWSMVGLLGDREGFTIYKIVAALDEKSRTYIKDTNTTLENKLDQILTDASEKSYHLQLDIPITPINYFGRYTAYIGEQPAWDKLKTGNFFNALGDVFNSALGKNDWQFSKPPYLDLVPYPSEVILRDTTRYIVQPDGWAFMDTLEKGGDAVKKYIPYTGQQYVKIVHHKLAEENKNPLFPDACEKSAFGLFSSPQDTCYTWYDNPTPAQEKYLEFYSPLTDPTLPADVKNAANQYYALKAEVERIEKNGTFVEKAGLGAVKDTIENLRKTLGWKIEESVILHVVDLPFTAAECSIYVGGAPEISSIGGQDIPAYIRGAASTQRAENSFDGTTSKSESSSWRYEKSKAQVTLEVAPIERRIKSLEDRLRNAQDPDPEWVKAMNEQIREEKDRLVEETKKSKVRWNAYYNVTEGDVSRFGAYYDFLERVGVSETEFPQTVEANRLYDSSKDAFLIEKDDGNSYVDPATLVDPIWYGAEDQFAGNRPSGFSFPDFFDSRRHGYLGGCSPSNLKKVEDPALNPVYTNVLRKRLETEFEQFLAIQKKYIENTELTFDKFIRLLLGPIAIWEIQQTSASTLAYLGEALVQMSKVNTTLMELLYDTTFNPNENKDDPIGQAIGEFQNVLKSQEKTLLPLLGQGAYASFTNDVKTMVKTGLGKAMEVEDAYKTAQLKNEEDRRNENKKITIIPAEFGVQGDAQTFEMWNGEGKEAALEFIYALARERYMNRLADALASKEVPEKVYREMQDTSLKLIRSAVSAKSILDAEVIRIMLIRAKEQAVVLKGLVCDPIRALMPIEDPAGAITTDDASYVPLRTTNPKVTIRSANTIEPDAKGAISTEDIDDDEENKNLTFDLKSFVLGMIPGQKNVGQITEGGRSLSTSQEKGNQYTHVARTRDPRTGDTSALTTAPTDDFYTAARSGFTIVSDSMDTSVKTLTTDAHFETGYQACLRYARYGVDPSLIDAVSYKEGELEKLLEDKVTKKFSIEGIGDMLGELFKNPLALLVPPILPGNAWNEVFGKELESASKTLEELYATAKYLIPKSLFAKETATGTSYIKDVNDPATRRELYSIHGLRRIATVVPHKEPTNETIARQLAAGTTVSLPVDAPRYVDFYLYEPIPELNQYGEVNKWNEYEEHVRIPYLNFFKLYDASKAFAYKIDNERKAFMEDQNATVSEVEKMVDGFNNYLVDYVAKTSLSGPDMGTSGEVAAFTGNPKTSTGLENIRFTKDDFYQTLVESVPQAERGADPKKEVQRTLAFSVYWQHLSLAEKYKFVMHNYLTSAPKADVTDMSFFSQVVNYTTSETKQKIGFESGTLVIPEKNATAGVVALENLSRSGELLSSAPTANVPLAQIPTTTEERCDPTYASLGGSKYGVPIQNWGAAMYCWLRTNFPPLENPDTNVQRFRSWAGAVDQTVKNTGQNVEQFVGGVGKWGESTVSLIANTTNLVATGVSVGAKEVVNFLGDTDQDGLSVNVFPGDANTFDPDINKNAVRDGQDAVGKILLSTSGGELLLDQEQKSLALPAGANVGVLKMGSSNPISLTAILATSGGATLFGNNYDYVELSVIEGDDIIQVLDSQRRQRVANGMAEFKVFSKGGASGIAKVKVTLVKQPVPNSTENFQQIATISAEMPIYVTDESLSSVYSHIPCTITERENNTCVRPDIKDAKPDSTFLATEKAHIFSLIASSQRDPAKPLVGRDGKMTITYYRDKVSKDTIYKEIFFGRENIEVVMKDGIWQGALRIPQDAGLYIVEIRPEESMRLAPLRATFSVVHSEYTSFDLKLTPNVIVDGDTVTIKPEFLGADGKPVQKLLGSASIGIPKNPALPLTITNKDLLDAVQGGDTDTFESIDFKLSNSPSIQMKVGEGNSIKTPTSVPLVLSRVSPLKSASTLTDPKFAASKELLVYPKGALKVEPRFISGATSTTINALSAGNVCTEVSSTDASRMIEVNVQIKDASGKVVPYTGELLPTFSDDSMIASSDETVALVDGKGRFTFIPNRKAGTLSITFADSRKAITGGSVVVVIAPGSLTKLKFLTESGQALSPHEAGEALSLDNYLHGEYVGLDACDNVVEDPNTVILLDTFPNLSPDVNGDSPASLESINTGGVTSDIFKVAVANEEGRNVDAQKLVHGKNAFVLKAHEYMGEIRVVLRAAQFSRDGSLSVLNNVATDELRVPIRFTLNKDLVQKMQPNILYTNLLGGAYGDLTQKDFLAGWWMLSGKAQAVTASTVGQKKQPNVAKFLPNGLPVLTENPDAPSSYKLEARVTADEPFQIEVLNAISGTKTISVRYHIVPFAANTIFENYDTPIVPETTHNLAPGMYFVPAEGVTSRKEQVQNNRSIVRLYTTGANNQLREEGILADNMQFFAGSSVYPEMPQVTVDADRKDILRLVITSPGGVELGVLYVKLPDQKLYPTEKALSSDVNEVILNYSKLNSSPLADGQYGLSQNDITKLNQATSILNLEGISNTVTSFQKKVVENISEVVNSSNGIFFERPLRNLMALKFDGGNAEGIYFADTLLLPFRGIREYIQGKENDASLNRFSLNHGGVSNVITLDVKKKDTTDSQSLLSIAPKWKASQLEVKESSPNALPQATGLYGIVQNNVQFRTVNGGGVLESDKGVYGGALNVACSATANKDPLLMITKEGKAILCKTTSELTLAKTYSYSKPNHTLDVVFTLLENKQGTRELGKMVLRFANTNETRILPAKNGNVSNISLAHQGVYVESLRNGVRLDSATNTIVDGEGKQIVSLARTTFFEVDNTDRYDLVVENSELVQIAIKDKRDNQLVARMTLQPYEAPLALDYNASSTTPTFTNRELLSLGLLSSNLQLAESSNEVQVTDTASRKKVVVLEASTGAVKEISADYVTQMERLDNAGMDVFVYAKTNLQTPVLRISLVLDKRFIPYLSGEYRANGVPALYVAERKPLLDIRQNTSTKEYEVFRGFDLIGKFLAKGGLEAIDANLKAKFLTENTLAGTMSFGLEYNQKEFSKAIYKLDLLNASISSLNTSSDNLPSLFSTTVTNLFGREQKVMDGWLYAPFRFIQLSDIQASLQKINGYLTSSEILAKGNVTSDGKVSFTISSQNKTSKAEKTIATLTPTVSIPLRSFTAVAGKSIPNVEAKSYIFPVMTSGECKVVKTYTTHEVEVCLDNNKADYFVKEVTSNQKKLALSIRSDGSYAKYDTTWMDVNAEITSTTPARVDVSAIMYAYGTQNPASLSPEQRTIARTTVEQVPLATFVGDDALSSITTNVVDVNKYTPAGTYLTFPDSPTALYRTLNGVLEYCADKTLTNPSCEPLLSLAKPEYLKTLKTGVNVVMNSRITNEWQPLSFTVRHSVNGVNEAAATLDMVISNTPLSSQIKSTTETTEDKANIIVRVLSPEAKVEKNNKQIAIEYKGENVASLNTDNIQFSSVKNVNLKPLSVSKDSLTYELISAVSGNQVARVHIVFNPGAFSENSPFTLALSQAASILSVNRNSGDEIEVRIADDVIGKVDSKGVLSRSANVPATFLDNTVVALSSGINLQRIRVAGAEVASHDFRSQEGNTLLQIIATTFIANASPILQIKTPRNTPDALKDNNGSILAEWNSAFNLQAKQAGITTQTELLSTDGIVQNIKSGEKTLSTIKIYTPSTTTIATDGSGTTGNQTGYDMKTSDAVMKLLGGNGIFVQMVDSEEGALSFDHEISGNATNSTYALVLKDKRIPYIALGNDDGMIGVEDALSISGDGVGYRGDFKNMVLFAAGNNVGQSTLPHMTYATINLGDPVVALNIEEADSTNDYFTDDIGNIVHTHTGNAVQDIELYDYDGDGKKDIIYTDGSKKIYGIRNIGTTLPDWKYEGELFNIPEGIKKLLLLKTTNGDSLMVATSNTKTTAVNENNLADLATSNFIELHKDGGGMFSRCEQSLKNIGEIEDMQFGDMDGDGADDIVVVTKNKEIKTILVKGNEDCLKAAATRFQTETVDKLGMELTGTAEGDMLRMPDTDVFARFNADSVDQKRNTPIVSSAEAPTAYPANPDAVFVRTPGVLKEGQTSDEARMAAEQLALLKAMLPAGQTIIQDSGPQTAQVAKMFVSAELPYIRSGGIYELRLNEVLDELRKNNPQSLLPKWLPLGGVVDGIASQFKPVFDFISGVATQKNARLSVEENLSKNELSGFIVKKYGKDLNGGYIQEGDKIRYKITIQNNLSAATSAQTPTTKIFDIADRLQGGTKLLNDTVKCTLIANGTRQILTPTAQKCGPNNTLSDPLFDMYFTDLTLAPGQAMEIEYVTETEVDPVSVELTLIDFKSYYEGFEKGLYQFLFSANATSRAGLMNLNTVANNRKVITLNTSETQSNGLLTYWRDTDGSYVADILKKLPAVKPYASRIPVIGDLINSMGLGSLVEGAVGVGAQIPILGDALEVLGLDPSNSGGFKGSIQDLDKNKITDVQKDMSEMLKEVFLTSDRDMDGLIDLWDDDVRDNPTPNNTDINRIGSSYAGPWQDIVNGASAVAKDIGTRINNANKYMGKINSSLRNTQCNFGGYCPIPNEWNYAIGAPGEGAIAAIPANFDIPVFAAPTPAGLIWPPDPTYFTAKDASTVRIYFTPTLTGRFALSVCGGPYSLGTLGGAGALAGAAAGAGASVGNCMAFLLPDFLGIRELCANLADSLTYFADGTVTMLTRGSYAIARATKSQSIVPLGGKEILTDFNTAQFVFTTDRFKNPTSANPDILKNMKSFFQEVARLNTNSFANDLGVPLSVGFPAFIMQWFEKQMQEITTKLLTPPKLYVYLPDPITGLFIPRDSSMSREARAKLGDLTLGEKSEDAFKKSKQKGASESEKFLRKEKETQIQNLTEQCSAQVGSNCNNSLDTAILTMAAAQVNDLRTSNITAERSSNVTEQQATYQQMLAKSSELTKQLALVNQEGADATRAQEIVKTLQGANIANMGQNFEQYADLVEEGYEFVYKQQAADPDLALEMRQTALRYQMYNNDINEGRRSVEQCYARNGEGNIACALDSAKYSLSSTAETALWKSGLNSNQTSTVAGMLNQGVGIDQIRKRVKGIDEMLNIIGSIPLLSIESRDVVFQFPWVSPARITDMTYSLEAAKNQSLQNFTNFYSRHRECFFEENDETGELAFRIDMEPSFTVRPLQSAAEGDPYARGGLTAEAHAKCLIVAQIGKEGWSGIQGITQNIERLKQYAGSFAAIKQFQQWRTYILSQVTDTVANIINQFAVYINDQNRIIRGWQGTLQTLIAATESVQVLVDLFQNFSKRCQNCGNVTEQGTKYADLMDMLSSFIRLDVVPMAGWPDLEIDLSNINFRLAIVVPNLRFVPRELTLPRVQAISFPVLDGLSPLALQSISRDGLGIAIPVLPPMPQIPELPDMPAFQIPKLPDLPPPPTIPQLNVQIRISIQTIGRILEMVCLLNKNIFPVPESGLRSHIEKLTASTFSIKTQKTRQQVPVVAGLEKIRLSMDINYYFNITPMVDVANLLAQGWNQQVGQIVNWSYKYLADLPNDLMGQAANYFSNQYMGTLVRDMNTKLGEARNGVNSFLQNNVVYPINNVPELIKETTDQKLREQQEIQNITASRVSSAATDPWIAMMVTELTSMQSQIIQDASAQGVSSETFIPDLEKQIAFLRSEEAGLPADIRDRAVEQLSTVVEKYKAGPVVANTKIDPMSYRFMQDWTSLSEEVQQEEKNSSSAEDILADLETIESFDDFKSTLAKADMLATEDLQSKPVASLNMETGSTTESLNETLGNTFTVMPISAADFDEPKTILRDTASESTSISPEPNRPLAMAETTERSGSLIAQVPTANAQTPPASTESTTTVSKANATDVQQGSLLISLPGSGGLIALTSYKDELTAERAFALGSLTGKDEHPDAIYAFGRDIFVKYNAFGTGKVKADRQFKGANPVKTMVFENLVPGLPPVYGEKVTKTTPTVVDIQFHKPDRTYSMLSDGHFDRTTPMHFLLRMYPTLEDSRNGTNYMEYYIQTIGADAMRGVEQSRALLEQNWRNLGYSVNTPGFKERARTLGMSEQQLIVAADDTTINLSLPFTRQKQYFAQILPLIPQKKILGVASSTMLLHPDRASDVDAPEVTFKKGNAQDVPTESDVTIDFAVEDSDNPITSIYLDMDMIKDTDGDGNSENDKDAPCVTNVAAECAINKTGENSYAGTFKVKYSTQEEGLHTIRVFAEDAIGNATEASVELSAVETEIRIESYDQLTGIMLGSIYPPEGGKELRLLRVRDKNITELILPDKVVTAPDGTFSVGGVKASTAQALLSKQGAKIGEVGTNGEVVFTSAAKQSYFTILGFDASGAVEEKIVNTAPGNSNSAITFTAASDGATLSEVNGVQNIMYKNVAVGQIEKNVSGMYSFFRLPGTVTNAFTQEIDGGVRISLRDAQTNREVGVVSVPGGGAQLESSRVRGALHAKDAFFDIFTKETDLLFAATKAGTNYSENTVYTPLFLSSVVEVADNAGGVVLKDNTTKTTLLELSAKLEITRRDNSITLRTGSNKVVEVYKGNEKIAMIGY